MILLKKYYCKYIIDLFVCLGIRKFSLDDVKELKKFLIENGESKYLKLSIDDWEEFCVNYNNMVIYEQGTKMFIIGEKYFSTREKLLKEISIKQKNLIRKIKINYKDIFKK